MHNQINEVQQVITEYETKYPATKSIDLLFDDCAIKVFSNSEELIKRLDKYFGEFTSKSKKTDITVIALETAKQSFDTGFTIKEPDPGKTKIKEEFANFPDGRIVRKRLTGMTFLFGKGKHLAIGPCVENANQVVNFIINRFIQWALHKDGLLLHAAGVERNGKGLALAGFSGMGKSTLALHIMSQRTSGISFVSNDRLITMSNGTGLSMRGVPKLPRVNPGTIINNKALEGIMSAEERKKISAMNIDELWDLEQKYDVFIDECFGGNRFKLLAQMKALVILNWSRSNDEFKFRKVNLKERLDLFPAFIKGTGLFYEPNPLRADQDFSDKAYLHLLEKCDVYEMTGRIDFEKGAKACLDIIG